MREITIPWRDGLGARIDQVVVSLGLSVSLRTTLASFPGSIHWHLKKGRARGTLELTLWPHERRMWISIQDGRRGNWTDAAADELKRALTEA